MNEDRFPTTVPAENVLPGVAENAALLRLDEQTAVGVTNVLVYPNGFSLELWLYQHARTSRRHGLRIEPVVLQVRYADGRSGETTVPAGPGAAPASAVTTAAGTAGTAGLLVLPRRSAPAPGPATQQVWVSPLPAAGPVEIVLTALDGRVHGRTDIPAADLLNAAGRAVEVWPSAPRPAPVFDADLASPLPPSGKAPVAQAEAIEAIRSAFRQAFTGQDPSEDASLDAVQDGEVLRGFARRAGALQSEVAASLQVALGGVAFLDPVRAAVQYQLRWTGAPEYGPQLGYAVFERGTWKVARDTYCRMLGWAGVECPPPPPSG